MQGIFRVKLFYCYFFFRSQTMDQRGRKPVAEAHHYYPQPSRGALVPVSHERKSPVFNVRQYVPIQSTFRRKALVQRFPVEAMRGYVFQELVQYLYNINLFILYFLEVGILALRCHYFFFKLYFCKMNSTKQGTIFQTESF